jgi:hypothetical protein
MRQREARVEAEAGPPCYSSSMTVELLKETQGKTTIIDNLPFCERLRCSLCDQSYQFRYSNGESSRLKEWLPKAQAVVNKSHADGHSAASLSVPW